MNKKILSLFLVIILSFGLSLTSHAYSNDEENTEYETLINAINETDANNLLSFLKSVQPEWSKEIEADVDFANEWRSLINNKSIFLDGNKIRLNKCNTINDIDLLNTIEIWI